jgi:acyl-CoA thioesterase
MAPTIEQDEAQSLADTVGRAMYARDHNSHALGIQLEEIRPGYARMQLKVRREMTNGHDTCHGGIIFTLADTAFAYACNSRNLNTVASGASIDFVAPAHAGDTLLAVAEERVLAGRTGVYDIEVRNQHGEPIAYFRGKSYRVKGEFVARPQDQTE